MNNIPKTASISESESAGKRYLIPFILVTSLFFLWGMVHNFDSILIPHLKKACQLNNRQSTLIDTAVFLAYFLMAIPSGIILQKHGYKKSIIIGLVISAIGAFLFVPAAQNLQYELFLVALFIIGCGITLLETTANPYAAVLGDPAGATQRLNLAAAFNGIAAMVAPVVGTAFILSGKEFSKAEMDAMPAVEKATYLLHEASSVILPYIILGASLLIVAILFYFVQFPEVKTNEDDAHVSVGSSKGFFSVLRHRHLSWAVIAQFFYVGAQVCVTSFFIRMAQKGAGFDEKTAGYYLGIYGSLFMGGRFAGTFFLRFIAANRLLAIYSIACVILSAIAIFGNGVFVIYALGALGFFMSIMFPTIFSLGIANLGEDTKQGSSWIIMAIVGGAILPYLMGTVIDNFGDNIQLGYAIPLICYLIILYFSINGYKVKNSDTF
ncbi:MAG: L-fucose:H+ symporter permease [Spirosomataceae bacterium]